MYFKNLLGFFILAFMVGSCGPFVNEGPISTKDFIEVSTESQGDSQCKIDFESIKKEFFGGKLSQARIEHTLQCTLDALEDVSSKVVTKTNGLLTLKEIQAVINTRVLGEPRQFDIWIERLFSIRHILMGADTGEIYFSDVKKILNRVKKAAPLLTQLSGLFSQYKKFTKTEFKFWELRKEMFPLYMEAIRILLDEKNISPGHMFPKELILKQYNLWEVLEEEIGSHFIRAGYLANEVLLGNANDMLSAQELLVVIGHLEFIYAKVSDIQYLLESKLWTPQESISFLYAYEQLLEYLFKIFLKTDIEKIRKDDLIQLLEYLHASVGGKAKDFVEAILSFKKALYGGDEVSFGRSELFGLMGLFHKSIEAHALGTKIFEDGKDKLTQEELRIWLRDRKDLLPQHAFNAYFRSYEDFNKQIYLWTTPFEKKDFTYKQNYLLTQVALPLSDRVIEAYDTDGDQKLSLKLFHSEGSEIGFAELASLVQTLQRSIRGLDRLLGETKDTGRDLLNLSTPTLGKAIILFSDQILLNSNADQMLDRYEILEATSFVLENSRAATWFAEDIRLKQFQVKVGEGKDQEIKLKREGLVEVLKEVPTLHWYFPRALKALSKEEIQIYIELIISVVGREDPKLMSMGELEMVFAAVRLMEVVFLRYDVDDDGILNEREVRAFYNHISGTLEALIDQFQSKEGVLDSWPLIGPLFKRLGTVLKGFYTPLFSKDRINRKVFEYAVSRGKLPEGITNILFFQKEVSTDRIKLVKLFANIYKEIQQK